MSIKKKAVLEALQTATKLAVKAASAPSAGAFVTNLVNSRSQLHKRMKALAERWQKSLPDLRTGNPERALERECCLRELLLATEEHVVTVEETQAQEA